MRGHIDWHAGDRARKVGSVIEIEAAEVVLIGFAFSAVLTDHDARYRFQHLAGPHDRPRIELSRGDRPLTGGLGDAHQILRRVLDEGFRTIAERISWPGRMRSAHTPATMRSARRDWVNVSGSD